jgi:hypothetical protein
MFKGLSNSCSGVVARAEKMNKTDKVYMMQCITKHATMIITSFLVPKNQTM